MKKSRKKHSAAFKAQVAIEATNIIHGGWDDEQVTTGSSLLPLYRALKQAGAKKVRFVAFQTDDWFLNVRDELTSEIIQWVQSDVSGPLQQDDRK